MLLPSLSCGSSGAMCAAQSYPSIMTLPIIYFSPESSRFSLSSSFLKSTYILFLLPVLETESHQHFPSSPNLQKSFTRLQAGSPSCHPQTDSRMSPGRRRAFSCPVLWRSLLHAVPSIFLETASPWLLWPQNPGLSFSCLYSPSAFQVPVAPPIPSIPGSSALDVP